ncbi:MAG TPA: NADH-quinone oxidoreductase subunit H [Acetobacteraceae bacterium]|nr:NADH-quinone oxidoreductase subunit H [Acetobacteraceae bacterium]
MNLLSGFIAQLLHMALLAAAAPTLIGVLHWLQARLSGHVGPPLLQPWRDLLRLLRKQPVRAESASVVTGQAPIACAAATAVAACLVPSFALGMLFAPFADLLLIFGLLIAARWSLALTAVDAGTALGGIAASRVVLLGCLVEPVLLLVMLAAALLAGSLNLDLIAAMQQEGGWQIGSALALAALLVVGLIDTTSRDMLAEQLSGPDLALVEASAAVRLLVWFNLIGAMFLPFGMAPAGTAAPAAWALGLMCWLGKTLVFTAMVAAVKTLIGRISLARAAKALGVAILLGLLATGFLLAQAGFAEAGTA